MCATLLVAVPATNDNEPAALVCGTVPATNAREPAALVCGTVPTTNVREPLALLMGLVIFPSQFPNSPSILNCGLTRLLIPLVF